MIQLDIYSVKARLYPCFLVLLPAFVVCIYYINDFHRYIHYITTIFSLGLFTFLLSQLGRDKGKKKEPALFVYFGGKPTTQILQFRNDYLDSATKRRYFASLTNLLGNVKMPTSKDEIKDPLAADKIYESCAKYLISKTRDKTKFDLLFKENVNYGFRRNLWAMKSWGLIVLFACIIFHLCVNSKYFSSVRNLSPKSILLLIYFLISIIFWIFVVSRNWIKATAFAYAERLYESLNTLV